MDAIYAERFEDRLKQLEAKIEGTDTNRIVIIGDMDKHIAQMKESILKMREIIKSDQYDMRDVANELSRLEEYFTVVTRI